MWFIDATPRSLVLPVKKINTYWSPISSVAGPNISSEYTYFRNGKQSSDHCNVIWTLYLGKKICQNNFVFLFVFAAFTLPLHKKEETKSVTWIRQLEVGITQSMCAQGTEQRKNKPDASCLPRQPVCISVSLHLLVFRLRIPRLPGNETRKSNPCPYRSDAHRTVPTIFTILFRFKMPLQFPLVYHTSRKKTFHNLAEQGRWPMTVISTLEQRRYTFITVLHVNPPLPNWQATPCHDEASLCTLPSGHCSLFSKWYYFYTESYLAITSRKKMRPC